MTHNLVKIPKCLGLFNSYLSLTSLHSYLSTLTSLTNPTLQQKNPKPTPSPINTPLCM